MECSERPCPVCGDDDDSHVVAEADFDEALFDELAFASRKTPEFMHFRLVRCPRCDLVYANPAPTADWLRGQYRAAHFDAPEPSRHAAATYARELARFEARLPSREGALDIGAGDGAFVTALLERGWSGVVGLEPSRAPIEQATDDVRPHLREGFFASDAAAPESLSLVTCFQTLEHGDDPLAVFHAAFEWLRPGGAFFAIAHDSRALSAKLLGTRSPIFDIEHLQLHSRRSLAFQYERAGFTGVEIRGLRNDYPLAYWLKLLPLAAERKKSIGRGLERVGLGKLVVPVWPGNLAAVGFKPG